MPNEKRSGTNKTKKKKPKILVVAVIDQLETRDATAFTTFNSRVQNRGVDCSPAPAETWYATLATLDGVMGGDRHEQEGSSLVREEAHAAGRPALLDALRTAGVRCCVLTGRSVLANLLDPHPHRADLRATFVPCPGPAPTGFQLDVRGVERPLELDFHVTPGPVEDLGDPRVDEALLELALHAIDLTVADPLAQDTFLLLGLTVLDQRGHPPSRESTPTRAAALAALDEMLSRLQGRLNRDLDAELVVTSRHGADRQVPLWQLCTKTKSRRVLAAGAPGLAEHTLGRFLGSNHQEALNARVNVYQQVLGDERTPPQRRLDLLERLWGWVREWSTAHGDDLYLIDEAMQQLGAPPEQRMALYRAVELPPASRSMFAHSPGLGFLSRTPVTREQYRLFDSSHEPIGTGNGPGPVVQVSWRAATAFCKWIAVHLDVDARLPTIDELRAASSAESTRDALAEEWSADADLGRSQTHRMVWKGTEATGESLTHRGTNLGFRLAIGGRASSPER